MSPLLALTLTAALSAPAASPAPADASLLTHAARIAAEARPLMPGSAARAPWASPGGDSLRNGTTTGAILGALISGAVFGVLCYSGNDGDNRGADCTKAALLGAGIGAAGGAAIGAGADALFSRARVARARVRF